MVMVGNRDIPDTEIAAKNAGWIELAAPTIQSFALPLNAQHYQKNCLNINIGDLCDAVVHPDGSAEATYCNENKLCARAYRSP